jgi:AsmA protein
MGRFLKIVLSILLLLVIAVIALPFFIDVNDFKPEIQSAVKDKTGRELKIEGDLELSVFPWLGVTTGNLELSNAPEFSDKPFAKIDASNIKVKLIPLLSKKLEVNQIELKGLTLNLAKNKQGKTNWDDLTQTKPNDASEKNQPAQTAGETQQENPLAALSLGGIAIEQAHIIWDDQQQGKFSELSDFNLTTDALIFNQPIDVEVSFNLTNKNPDITESLSLSTQLTVNEALNNFELKGVDLKSLTSGKDIPDGKINLTLQSDMTADLTSQSYALSGLQINATELMQNKLSADLSADLAINLNQQTLSVAGLRLNAGDLKLTADIKGTQIKDKPSFSGPINIAPFNLAKFMQSLDMALPEMKDSQALSLLSTTFNLQATTDSATINNLLVKLDDTQLKGSASIKNFSKPAVKFNFNIDFIDVGRYLPPEKQAQKTEKPSASASASAVATAELFPVEMLKNLNANGQVTLGNLTMDQLKMKGVGFKINAVNGVIKTQQGIKQLYQGAYSGNSSINVQSKTPVLTLNEKLSNIQVEPLLKALDITERMTGLVNGSIKVEGRGNSTKAIKSSLNGNAFFSFKDSVITGFNLQKLIDNSRLLLQNKALPAESKKDQTLFSIIKGNAQIRNGVVYNNDLLAQSSKIQINGGGTANLATEALKYKIITKVLKHSATDTRKEKIKGIPLAIKIGGDFSKPSYTLDIETMVKAKYQDKIDKVINKNKDKLFDKLDKKLGQGVGDALKGLF